jgi:hypothetical protein
MGSTRTGFVRRAAALGIGSPVVFVLLVIVMGFIHPGYSHLTNFISDLGALDAPMPYVQRLNFFQFGMGITALAWALYLGMEQPSRVALVLQLTIGVVRDFENRRKVWAERYGADWAAPRDLAASTVGGQCCGG